MGPSPFTYTPSRTTQPYRQGEPRPPGAALSAMLAGSDLYGRNPADIRRESQRRPHNPDVREGSLWWHLLNLPQGNVQFRAK